MIIDNNLLVSTANYTSTQFAFGCRRMEFIEGGADKTKHRKEDNFSEVNGFVILPNCSEEVLGIYSEHFNELWANGENIEINF